MTRRLPQSRLASEAMAVSASHCEQPKLRTHRVTERVQKQVLKVLLPLGCALLILMTTSVRAQTTDHDAAFERGLDALHYGKLQEALLAFQESLRIAPRAETWLQLGVTYARLEQPHAAYEALDTFLASADPIAAAADTTLAQAELTRLRAISTVLVLATTPDDTQIHVDGRVVAPRHREIWLTPGSHRIAVSALGYITNSQVHNLPAGRYLYTLRLQPSPNAAAAAVPPPASQSAEEIEISTAAANAEAPRESPSQTIASAKDHACIFQSTCFGLLASVGAPNALGLGAWLRVNDHLALGFDAHLLPTIDVSGTKASTQLYLASLHIHPFGDGWFASAGLGLQRLLARAERPTAIVKAKVNIPVLALGLGYIGRSGLVLGIDLSLLVPLQRTDLTVLNQPKDAQEAALYERLRQEANQAVDSLRHLLPFMFQVNLVRVGYLF